MQQTNKHKFHLMLDNAISSWKLESTTKKFAEYFENNYKLRSTQWASCYRINSGINTNMYVESFHHVLKYNFLKGKANKRVDALICILMRNPDQFSSEITQTKYRTGVVNALQVLVYYFTIIRIGLSLPFGALSIIMIILMITHYCSSDDKTCHHYILQ